MADPSNEYCAYEDVESRLTRHGYLYMAQRDDVSGSNEGVSEGERDRYILTAIKYAGGIIDGAIDSLYSISYARGSGNQWLRDRATDIACYRACSNGGEDAGEDFRQAYRDALDLLKSVQYGGMRIPGLAVETPRGGSARRIGIPRAGNPRRRRGGGSCGGGCR